MPVKPLPRRGARSRTGRGTTGASWRYEHVTGGRMQDRAEAEASLCDVERTRGS